MESQICNRKSVSPKFFLSCSTHRPGDSHPVEKNIYMEIVIFGATGQVGRQLVTQALLKQFKVRAYGRNVHQLPDINKDLLLIRGGVFDDLDVLKAIEGCDAVFSVLGGSFDGTDKTRSLGMKIITEQMTKAGVNRIIALGGKGVLDAPDGGLIIDQEDYPAEYLPVGREHQKAWEFLRASRLDWTFVCSPDIINADATGKFITHADTIPEPDNGRINAGDLALFMLNELDRHEYSCRKVGISEV